MSTPKLIVELLCSYVSFQKETLPSFRSVSDIPQLQELAAQKVVRELFRYVYPIIQFEDKDTSISVKAHADCMFQRAMDIINEGSLNVPITSCKNSATKELEEKCTRKT
jgi:hypothetical protein